MKRYNKITTIALAVVMLLTGISCSKSFFTDANKNPNAPDPGSIVPGVMLSTVEGALAYMQGGDLSRYTSLITQQTVGTARQAQGYYSYTFTSVDFDNVWANIYTAVLQNNVTMMQIADAGGYNRYSGIARILMAYTLQISVDAWGSIPYSDALKGSSMFQAKYDTDQGLYDSIVNLIDAGITLLNNPDPGNLIPGAEDVLYGGVAAKWIKFAHAIKARVYIHQSKGNATMANNALAELDLAFTSNADNATYIFGNTETSANPWYQFNQQRTDIGFAGSTFTARLTAANDPRLPIFMDTGDDLLLFYGNINSPVELINYDELLFMRAEAILRSSGNIASAQTFYRQGIRRNMEKLGVAPADTVAYLAANGTLPGTVSAAINKVAHEEFTALYLNPEAWALWRRTGVPAISPVTGSNVPRRLLYPQTEYSYNESNTPSATLFSPKVFWDN